MIQIERKLNVAITAGASGIGLAIAESFAAQGADVYCCDISDEHIQSSRSKNPTITTLKADVGSHSDMEEFFNVIASEVGHLDVLVGNAGIAGPTAQIEDIDPQDWSRTIQINLNGMFHATKYAIPLLRRSDHASIVLMSSSAAYSGYPNRSPYAASKWAIIGMMKTLAMELGPHGIRVNALCPGSVKGPRIDAVIKEEARLRKATDINVRKEYERQVSLRSFVEKRDISDMVLFLASDHSKMITGQSIGVDGHTETLAQILKDN